MLITVHRLEPLQSERDRLGAFRCSNPASCRDSASQHLEGCTLKGISEVLVIHSNDSPLGKFKIGVVELFDKGGHEYVESFFEV
jgi:hypothetical protein